MIKNFVEFVLFRKLFAREGFGYLVELVGVLLVWDYQIQKRNRSLLSIIKVQLTN